MTTCRLGDSDSADERSERGIAEEEPAVARLAVRTRARVSGKMVQDFSSPLAPALASSGDDPEAFAAGRAFDVTRRRTVRPS